MTPPTSENYYKPYCPRCKAYVQPQVVSSTHVSGGGGSSSPVTSVATYQKMCPTCGEQVFSQADIDAYKEKKQTQIMVYGILAVFCCGPFTAIPALIMAARHRPLSTKGKVGVGLSIYGLIQFLIFVSAKLVLMLNQ